MMKLSEYESNHDLLLQVRRGELLGQLSLGKLSSSFLPSVYNSLSLSVKSLYFGESVMYR